MALTHMPPMAVLPPVGMKVQEGMELHFQGVAWMEQGSVGREEENRKRSRGTLQ